MPLLRHRVDRLSDELRQHAFCACAVERRSSEAICRGANIRDEASDSATRRIGSARGVATAAPRVSAPGRKTSLTVEIGDDKPEETSCRQRRHGGARVVRLQLRRRRRRTVGDEQRGEGAAVAKHDVAEAAALIDTGMPLQQLQRSVDRWRLERRERGVRRTVAAPGVFERDRPLGEIEFDGAVLVIAGRLARQPTPGANASSSCARTTRRRRQGPRPRRAPTTIAGPSVSRSRAGEAGALASSSAANSGRGRRSSARANAARSPSRIARRPAMSARQSGQVSRWRSSSWLVSTRSCSLRNESASSRTSRHCMISAPRFPDPWRPARRRGVPAPSAATRGPGAGATSRCRSGSRAPPRFPCRSCLPRRRAG